MKKFVFSIVGLCCFCSLLWSQECPPTVTATTAVVFKRHSNILPGRFSVAADRQVQFTKGNLQYNAAYNSWRFAEHQYDFIGNAAGNKTAAASRATQDAWIDLLGWGTSGYDGTHFDPTAIHFQPYASSDASTGYAANSYGYGPSTDLLTGANSWSSREETKNYDWGVYNFTAGEEAGLRTITLAEWNYLLKTRTNYDRLRGMATLFGNCGAILLPDGWNWSAPALAKAASAAGFDWKSKYSVGSVVKYTDNIIEDTEAGRALWTAMEEAGAVFLPAAGYRSGVTINYPNSYLLYWTSTTYSTGSLYAHRIRFFGPSDTDFYSNSYDPRSLGQAVRLVKDVTP